MEDSKKKPIMIAVIVACLGVAGAITYITSSGGGGIETIGSGEMMWVKCSNPDCGTEYQMNRKDYLEYVREHQKGMSTPPLICEKCGEESIYKAVKCPKCEVVFFEGSVREAKFKDTCPECGYSEVEEIRNKARQGG